MRVAATLFVALLMCGRLAAADRAESGQTWQKETVVYKIVGPTDVEADVYRRNGDAARPCVVWIHGGALIIGNRQGVPREIEALCRAENYVLVSLDYRLAPEVRLPAIIEDIQDAFRWLASDGVRRFHVDASKIAVTGGSAGGYLTMMTGFCVEPRPKVLVAYWGYGDVDGPWYTTPSEHYRQSPLVSKEDAQRAVGGPVHTSGGGDRGRYYLYLRQNGLWAKEVSGFDPAVEPRKFDPYCPVRHVTPSYPPILMIHGTADTDVPYQESADMAAALEKQGVEHELITVEGGGHGLGNVDKAIRDAAFERATRFIRERLK